MNERIKKLREESLTAVNRISGERAKLITDFYRSDLTRGKSVPVQRALSLKYILENKKLHISEGELIVGERGPAPKATPTYPEICLHSIKDLETIDLRKKVSFKVDDEVKRLYREEIIPFWSGRSLREMMFERLPQRWKDAYEAGAFTEFLEQRAPGHTVLGDKIYRMGIKDIRDQIMGELKNLDHLDDPESLKCYEELQAMLISCDAIVNYAKRYSDKLTGLSEKCDDPARKMELKKMAEICIKVPANRPETFHEALQYYWFVHVGVVTELNPWDSFNPGRLDQHLYPFYKKEISNGSLTEEKAKELLGSFWVKFNNHPAPPKMGVTAKESNTYTDFALINTGGLTPEGQDAVNELTYIILDVVEDLRLLQPSSMVQVSKQNPDRFLERALKIVKTGFGQPSIFNTDAIIQELTGQGKDLVDARRGGASGCVESGAFGTESYILTGYFNLAKILEITLNNGVDPKSGKLIGVRSGNPEDFSGFEDMIESYKKQVKHFADIKIEGNNIIGWLYKEFMPAPFLSLFIDDCISNGKDYNSGGARYNTSYIQGVGTGSVTDSLASIKYNVFEKKRVKMGELLRALASNFEEFESLRKNLINDTPKYGNDDDRADRLTSEIFEIFHEAVDGRPGPRGSIHRINLLPTTSHVYFGSVTGALPDGRKAGVPLSEGISPVQGADRKGPAAVIRSASKIDHLRTGGTLLNQKFTPSFFSGDKSLKSVLHLVRSYFRMDGHHIQFNVVSADTLRKAKKNPEEYRDLIVRVAGYSDYFVDLVDELQDEIIARTEHEAV